MGIDYAASYADVVEWSFIEQLVPYSAANFLAVLDQHRGDNDRDYLLAAVARCFQFLEGQDSELYDALPHTYDSEKAANAVAEINKAYHNLQNAFSEATLVHGTFSKLTLHLGRHNSEDSGCRGDEVDGDYWYVEGAYELSPAGKRHEKQITRKFFTTWG